MRSALRGWRGGRPSRCSRGVRVTVPRSHPPKRGLPPVTNGFMDKIARRWTQLGTPGVHAAGDGSAFRVLQWNILADGLAQNGDFVKVPDEALEWEVRWPLIQREIDESEAQIVCLQEVNTYEDFLEPFLLSKGYESFFLPKTRSPAERYGKKKDGSALFFKSSRFSTVDQPLGRPYQDGGQVMRQGLAAMHLWDLEAGRNLIVGCTHLKAKNGSQNEGIRRKQVSQLVTWVEEMISQGARDSSSNRSGPLPTAILICGDFNDTPDSRTCTHLSQSPLHLTSLWDVDVLGEAESTLMTTFKFRSNGEAKRVIDYIWFSSGAGLIPVQRWLMLDDKEAGPHGLPGFHYGSDHVAVCAEFLWH